MKRIAMLTLIMLLSGCATVEFSKTEDDQVCTFKYYGALKEISGFSADICGAETVFDSSNVDAEKLQLIGDIVNP